MVEFLPYACEYHEDPNPIHPHLDEEARFLALDPPEHTS
jgi:hypothetical protein